MWYQSALPLICRSAYPAGQAALLHNLRLGRTASSFLAYLDQYPESASVIKYLRIEDDGSRSWGDQGLDWLDRPKNFLSILERCEKLEAVHLTIRAGAQAPRTPGLQRPIVLPEKCRILSVGKGTTHDGGSLLGTLSSGIWRLHADTVRLECITSSDLVTAEPSIGTPINRFISARHLIIDVKRDNPNVYYPSQFSGFLASLETLPSALTIKKMRLDSSAFRMMVQHCGPSLDYLHFTWSAPASPTAQSTEYIDYLYGGRYNPLIVGTVLLPCKNLREIKIDIVDLVPLRGMRFPSSVKKLTVQWWTFRHFFTEFFPWLQNHLCTDDPQLEFLQIDIMKNWAARETHDVENTRRSESEIVQLVDDFCIAKAATQLCENHGVKTMPQDLEEAWKATRKAELPVQMWQEVCRRLGTELQSLGEGRASSGTLSNPFQI